MKTIYLIGHKKRMGKDTFAQFLAEETGGTVMSFAEPLKQIIADTFNLSVKDLEYAKNDGFSVIHYYDDERWPSQTYRDILQRFGNEAMKKQFGDSVWGDLMLRRIEASDAKVIIVPDFRFKVEYGVLTDSILGLNSSIVTVNVVCPSVTTEDTHPSETELDDFAYDLRILNDGTLEDLRLVAKGLVYGK